MTPLVLGIALVGIVLIVVALASGIVERAPLSFPLIFFGLGLGLGGTGTLNLTPHDPLLELVGAVSLALVLFLGAVNTKVDELRRDWRTPLLTLGPGTLLNVAGIAVAALFLAGKPVVEALLLGGVLASTDPVAVREIMRDERIPRSIRRALEVEAGVNDVVVLPIVLILIAVLAGTAGSAGDWLGFLARILVLSPLVGLAIGAGAAWLIGRADARFHIRREYQALFGLGIVLASFAAGQAVGGSGFVSAFAAGLAITLFNFSLCECFLEFGEVASEAMMMVACVLFGAVLVTLAPQVLTPQVLILAVLVLAVIRPAATWLVLARANMSGSARLFIGWFGPRGLSSLLLALLAVQAAVPGAETLLAVTGVICLVSVVAHGVSATPLSNWYAAKVTAPGVVLDEERESTFQGLFDHDGAPSEGFGLMSVATLQERLAGPNPPVVLDVRARAHYEAEGGGIPGSERVQADQVELWANGRGRERAVVAYCS